MAAAPDHPPSHGHRAAPLWRNVSFVLMWTSVAASGFGDRMIQLAAWPLLGLGSEGVQAASVQAAVTFFFFLPFFFFGPVGGWLADTLPRKWLMLGCDEMRALVLVIAAVLLWKYWPGYDGSQPINPDHPHAWLAYVAVYGLIALTGLFAAFFSPTRDATVPQIVPMRQLPSANAIVMAIATIASMVGLYAGDAIMRGGGIAFGVAVGAGCFLISGSFFAFMRVRPHVRPQGKARESELKRLVQAAGYVRQHKRLIALYGYATLFWGLAGVVLAWLAALVSLRYGLEGQDARSTFVQLQTALGAGMLISSVVMALLGARRESHWLILLGLLITGVATVVLWAVPVLWMGVVMAFVVGFAANVVRVFTDTLTQTSSANYIRGRVFGLREILTNAAVLLVNGAIWLLGGYSIDSALLSIMPWFGGAIAVVSAVFLVRELAKGPAPRRDTNAWWRFVRLLTFSYHRLEVVGKHHMPAQGPALLVSNHTAGLDPFALQSGTRRTVRWIMTKSYEFNVLRRLWRAIDPIVLNLDGSDREQVAQILARLKRGDVVGIFPEGGLQRATRALAPFEPGVGVLARRSGAPIVPAWIHGTPRAKPMWRHFLQPSETTVVFGEPWTPPKAMKAADILAELRRRMLTLEEQVPPSRHKYKTEPEGKTSAEFLSARARSEDTAAP